MCKGSRSFSPISWSLPVAKSNGCHPWLSKSWRPSRKSKKQPLPKHTWLGSLELHNDIFLLLAFCIFVVSRRPKKKEWPWSSTLIGKRVVPWKFKASSIFVAFWGPACQLRAENKKIIHQIVETEKKKHAAEMQKKAQAQTLLTDAYLRVEEFQKCFPVKSQWDLLLDAWKLDTLNCPCSIWWGSSKDSEKEAKAQRESSTKTSKKVVSFAFIHESHATLMLRNTNSFE